MYLRTVCPLGVKSLLNVLKSLYLLTPSDWVVSITCGRDGIRCPVLPSDPARAALVFSWVVSMLQRGLWCLEIFIWYSVQLHCAQAEELLLLLSAELLEHSRQLLQMNPSHFFLWLNFIYISPTGTAMRQRSWHSNICYLCILSAEDQMHLLSPPCPQNCTI